MTRTSTKRWSQVRWTRGSVICPKHGGRYFNHQTSEQGRNVVRYVPAAQVPALQESIDEYRRFMTLAEQYIAHIVQQTRQRHRQARHSQKSPSPAAPLAKAPRQSERRQKEEE